MAAMLRPLGLWLLNVASVLILILFIVLPSSSCLNLIDIFEQPHVVASDHNLTRHKRQALWGSRCPSEASKERVGETQSYLLFHSPIKRRDVRIAPDDIKTLKKNGFDWSKPTMIYTHGWTQSARSKWLLNVRKNFLQRYPPTSGRKSSKKNPDQAGLPFNLLFFDWSVYSRLGYAWSVSWVPHLGQVLAAFMRGLEEENSQGYDMSRLHILAYSLSPHFAGQAGRLQAARNKSNPLGQITALDPTGVCLHEREDFAKRYELKPTDAQLVVAKHYDMQVLGARRAIGGVDIFVNGGNNQPGVRSKRSTGEDNFNDGDELEYIESNDGADLEYHSDSNGDENDQGDNNGYEEEGESRMRVLQRLSNHYRASVHESEPIPVSNRTCHDVAYACHNYHTFLSGECADCGKQNENCYYLNTLARAIDGNGQRTMKGGTRMYIKTNLGSPLCLYHYQVRVHLKESDSSGAAQSLRSGKVSLELGSHLAAQPKHKMRNNSFTALVTSRNRIRTPKAIKVRYTGSSKSGLGELMKSVTSVEVNYMSNPSAEERAKASQRYCPGSNGNFLVKC